MTWDNGTKEDDLDPAMPAMVHVGDGLMKIWKNMKNYILGHVAIAFEHLDLILHQSAVLPADVLAVLVAGKHRLAILINDPPGVAQLL